MIINLGETFSFVNSAMESCGRGGVVQDFFRVGKILQVEITVTIDKNHGCKKIF